MRSRQFPPGISERSSGAVGSSRGIDSLGTEPIQIMKRVLPAVTALVGSLAVFGCATHTGAPVPSRPVPPKRILSGQWLYPAPRTGRLLLERENTIASRACGDEISLDGVAVAVLAAGERIELYPPLGDHLVTTKSGALADSRNVSAMCMGALAERVVTIGSAEPSSYRLLQVEGGELQIRPGIF